MSHFSQPAWTHPTPTEPRSGGPGRGLGPGGLLSGGTNARSESRRIAAGLAGLALISIVLLNFGILSGARDRLAKERWSQLSATLEAKRDEVRNLLRQFEQQAEFVVGQPIYEQSAGPGAHALTAAETAAVADELERAARTFDYRSIVLFDSSDRVIAHTGGGVRVEDVLPLVRQARTTSASVMGDIAVQRGSEQSMALAVPLSGAGQGAVMVFRGDMENVLLPILTSWPGFGRGAGAYLVKRDGDQILCLTSPPSAVGGVAGDRIALDQPTMRAAAMAVEGVESTVELPDAHGFPLWAVTRALPERDWGIVAQMDRGVALSGLRGTVVGLLALDLAMVVLGIAAIWFWRRQYKSGLARREIEVNRRHGERMQAIFDTAFDAILTFNGDWCVVSVNRAAASLFGLPPAAMEGRPLQQFVHRDGGGSASGADLAPGTVLRAQAVRADGALVPVEFSLGSAGEGAELLFTAIVRDVTERVESENRIQTFAQGLEQSNRRLEELNAQLEEASRLKSEFLANTSHELRTPLNGMIGFLQLVLDGLCDSPEEEREFQKQALQCSRHLLGLINDVLDIAKIEAGKLTLEIEKIDVSRLFDEVYTVTHVQAAQKGVKLRFEPPAEGAPGVRGDFGKVKQILINLVGNSLKFTPSGTITVRALPHPGPGHVMFEVQDTGIGIPLDRQQQIFEKFIQADGSTTRKYGGTGLGLAITRSLVELMGGIIGVQSDGEGHGTRMYFSLPIWNETTVAVEDEEGPSEQIEGPAGGALVLVVEDDAVFRRYLTSLLHGHGYRTVEARHAEGAWMLVRRLRPAIVVSDYALTCPEGANLRTGWDLAERMTEDNGTRHIPMIFVTGFDEELRDKLKATAFARKPSHLVKPVDGNVLIEKIQQMVGGISHRVIRVLMADDDPSVGAYLRKVLPVNRFHLEVTSNGAECIHALRIQPNGFDILLLDLMMPEVSGYDVLREMVLTGLSTSLPVLVLTNFPEPRNEEERRLLEEGLVLDVLPKTAVHDNPQLLSHVIDWQLQVVREAEEELSAAGDVAGDEPERAAA